MTVFFNRHDEINYRMGVSKTWNREYQQEKYGYGGEYRYFVVGSHKSKTPLSMFMGMTSTFMKKYIMQDLVFGVRIEGMEKSEFYNNTCTNIITIIL